MISCSPAGGGGSIHIQPKNIVVDKPIKLTYELTVWGGGSTDIEQRYSDVLCYFKLKEDKVFKPLKMQLESKVNKKGIYTCEIPKEFVKPKNRITFTETRKRRENKHLRKQ